MLFPKVRSYLWIYLFEVRVILVDLEVDFGGRYGHRPVDRNAGWHQDRWGADVDRAWKYVIDLKKEKKRGCGLIIIFFFHLSCLL